MTLAARKLVELNQKLESLKEDFNDWLSQSAAGQPLEKHHTQIRRVIARMSGLRDMISATVNAIAGNDANILCECRKLEKMALAVYRIWEFFRAKFSQRATLRLHEFLYAADELAWACYEPAQLSAVAGGISLVSIKEPPLIFFNGGSSPFTSARGQSYQPEMVPGEPFAVSQFTTELKSLPIPVIGVPYYQIHHLSDALMISHEVGHNVDDDLHLSDRIVELIRTALAAQGVPADRQAAWAAWSGEVFADVYGTVLSGPAFVGALVDFLANSPALVAADIRSAPAWGTYPTDYLRILVAIEVLGHRGFATDADRIRTEWIKTYPMHAMMRFQNDTPHVARALVDGPYPQLSPFPKPGAAVLGSAGPSTGISLAQLAAFSQADQDIAVTDARRMLNGAGPSSNNPRILFAIARLAYESSPVFYSAANVGGKILRHMPQRAGVRNNTRREQSQMLEQLDAEDYCAGQALFKRLIGETSA